MAKTSSYILMKLASLNTWWKKLRGNAASNQPAVLFHTCADLPLNRFMAIVIDSDLLQLVKSGNPSLADLSEAWANIYAEYMDMNGDNEGVYLLRLQTQIELLKTDLIEIEGALYCLTMEYRDELVTILEDRGVYIKLNPNDLEEYFEAIEVADASLAYQRLTLETLTNEYIGYILNREKQTIDKSYFLMTLRRIARFNHVAVIKPESITVEEFVTLLRDYLEYINANSKQLETE
jgi:hypothetical protein